MKKIQSGFTLIELMVAVAIVGILAAVAFPSYQESVRKSRRADAKSALMGLANAMERNFTVNSTYCDVAGAGGANTCGAAGTNDKGTPATTFYTIDPKTSAFYNITIDVATASNYTLKAEPKSGSAQASDKCGNLTLMNTGAKGFSGSGGTVVDCW